MKQPLKLASILTIGILVMSSAAIMIRTVQADGVPSLVIAAIRLSLATLALSIPAVIQRAWADYAKLTVWELGALLLSGVLLALHFATWVTSLSYTSVVSSVVLVTTTPLWLGLVSPLFLGERTSRLTWIGMAAAVIGGIVIGIGDYGGSMGSLRGNALALTGALCMAGYLLIGRGVRSRMRFIPYVWFVYGFAAVILLGWVAVAKLPLAGHPAHAWLWMTALGLLPQLIGHTATNYAVRHISATFVGIATLGEPIGSGLLAIIFLGEWPTLQQLIGGVLILIGIGLASTAEDEIEPPIPAG